MELHYWYNYYVKTLLTRNTDTDITKVFVEQPPGFVGSDIMHNSLNWSVSVLGRDKGYTVKYNPLPEGVPEGEA